MKTTPLLMVLALSLIDCSSSSKEASQPEGKAGNGIAARGSTGGSAAGAASGTGGSGSVASGTGGSGTAASGTGGSAAMGRAGRNGSSGSSGRGAATGGAGSSAPPPQGNGDGTRYGSTYEGGLFHLGPVDWEQTQWPNACAPGTKYSLAVRNAEGNLLAGLWRGIDNLAGIDSIGGYCDTCIAVTTAKGKSATLRVVTYGDTTMNSIDVSPDAFQILNTGENPRAMSWQFAKCPDTGPIIYEFQTGSSEWWTSFWLRNARVPIALVEVKSPNHDYKKVDRGTDGTLTDGGGFGKGAFTIRVTAVDKQQLVHAFDWPADGIAGKTFTAPDNFK